MLSHPLLLGFSHSDPGLHFYHLTFEWVLSPLRKASSPQNGLTSENLWKFIQFCDWRLPKALSHSINSCDDVEPCRLPSQLRVPRETSILLLLHSHLSMYIVILILLIIIMMMMMMTKGGRGLRERLFLTLLGDSAVPSLSCTMFSLQCTPMTSFNYDDDWRWWLLPLTDTETEAGCGGVSWNKLG